ncbi:hypothetical protein N7495_009467 [Penicillium taxi]|uniref:uncharacterized protein n=1 Tax=Penicillium taxi TaxID=168475 RepID=UPI0025454F4A|nr:uncharacterized protein N7495_009467 [Penicillium taxi]KAJ5884957.1 hypothetical protein N7495_009467 [Penicillium taxi]
MPVSHMTLTVTHLPTSTSFFLSCLQPLGYQFIGRQDEYIGFGQKQGEPADFWVTERRPGIGPSAVHIAFPAPSRDAVGQFFICALKAGGQIHGEPKTRDSQSGYYSAAVIDFDGNSIEAVYRPGGSVVASEAGGPTIAMLDNGSVVSRSNKAKSVKAESIAPPQSKAPTVIERAATVVSQPSYTVQTVQADDGSKAVKTIVGTLLGAAAGAAIAYAMVKGDEQSSSETKSIAMMKHAPDLLQIMAPPPPSQASRSEAGMRAIEAPPAKSTYSAAPRSTVSRSAASKNPRASTVYEPTEFALDQKGRRASEGTVASYLEDLPIRTIEYPPRHYPCSPSTFISSYAADKPRAFVAGSVLSNSTIKAAQKSLQRRRSHDDRSVYSTPSSHHSKSLAPGSIASSAHTAHKVPLPAGSEATYYSAAPTHQGYSYLSAGGVPLPASVADLDVRSDVTPDDSISQVGAQSHSGKSTHSHSHSRSHSRHSRHSKSGSRASKHSSRSKHDDGAKPSDNSSHVSRRTAKAGSKAPSTSGSRR